MWEGPSRMTGAKLSRKIVARTTRCTLPEPGSPRAGRPVVSAMVGVETIGREFSSRTVDVRLCTCLLGLVTEEEWT